MSSPILDELRKSRNELLELGLRNTLLNHRVLSGKGVEIVNERPDQVFRVLVEKGKAMTFQAAPTELEREGQGKVSEDLLLAWLEREQAGRSESPEGSSTRHEDAKLQTPLTRARLERVLLTTFYTARTSLEELGVNTLYLALGMLRWFESASSDKERSAPLLLVPVTLNRQSAGAKFRLRHNGEELNDNLSLRAKLREEFGIELPELPEVEEDFLPSQYFDRVVEAITTQARWRVDDQAVHLGFFSFTKLLMYQDLDPERWPEDRAIDEHPVLEALLGSGFDEGPSPYAAEEQLDQVLSPRDLHTISDSDSSQTLAILDVLGERNLVIQGPPGTGKSQTITNLIAECIGRGKRVLFVAEKIAALDVVKRRLVEARIGDACLELHSYRSNKRAVLEELRRTLYAHKPEFSGAGDARDLAAARDRLNAYVAALHSPIGESGVTPYQAYGKALKARERMAGITPPQLDGDLGSLDWSRTDFEQHLQRLREMERLLAEEGPLAESPFWSSLRKHQLVGPDRDDFVALCRELLEALTKARRAFEELARDLGLEPPKDAASTRRLLAAARLRLRMPRLDGVAVADSSWAGEGERVAALVESGHRHRSLHEERDGELAEGAWAHDVHELRSTLDRFGDRWWRSLRPDFRRAHAELSSLCIGAAPKDPEARIALVASIQEAQQLERAVNEESDLGSRLFGNHWQGTSSDWSRLDAATDWLREVHRERDAGRLPSGFLSSLGTDLDPGELKVGVDQANEALVNLEDLLEEVERSLVLQRATGWLRNEDEINVAFEDLEQRLHLWRDSPESLRAIVRFNHLAEDLEARGLGNLMELAANWPAASDHLGDLLTDRWHQLLLKHARQEAPLLAHFDGGEHNEWVDAYRRLDKERLMVNRARVALAHFEGLPPSNGPGEVGLLRRQMELTRRHWPIRKLMTEAGGAIQRIKPVFLMSPLSVATYLPPGTVEFDLVIFDEASQVRPVDAFGAILRAQRAVVVGDSKQLPPTSFFDKLLGGGDSDEEEEERSTTVDHESVLGLFTDKGAPSRMLRWHYRSRHESLIAVSNHEFYDDGLVVFPSPDHAKEELGVVLRHHPETVYEPRTKRYNLEEAALVADAVMEHARSRTHLTLGVAAFSQAQAQIIQDQLERRRRESPELEQFFAEHPHEPFFVKNLENVQGDERDVVFISVGYGKQKDDTLWKKFGPLNRDGGERRLNVLTTRARLRCEVFSNFRAADLALDPGSSAGLLALKRYLQYAETGQLDQPHPSERPPDSAFEEMVAARVRKLGYEVHHQVGSGGFFIDLAVVDSDRPGRYLLGIECDGRAYHSAQWARDRDRLRQEVLEGLGWTLHRIWSTDWFFDSEREMRKLRESLDRALALGATGTGNSDLPKGSEEARTDEHDEPFTRASTPPTDRRLAAEPYRVAELPQLRDHPLQDMPPRKIAACVTRVVETESPVHENVVIRRLVEAAGFSRVGARLKGAVKVGIQQALYKGLIRKRGVFLRAVHDTPPVPRDRSGLPSQQRRIEHIAPEEIEAAVVLVVEAASSIQQDEAVTEAARLLGFLRPSTQIRATVDEAAERLRERQRLEKNGGALRLPSVSANGLRSAETEERP